MLFYSQAIKLVTASIWSLYFYTFSLHIAKRKAHSILLFIIYICHDITSPMFLYLNIKILYSIVYSKFKQFQFYMNKKQWYELVRVQCAYLRISFYVNCSWDLKTRVMCVCGICKVAARKMKTIYSFGLIMHAPQCRLSLQCCANLLHSHGCPIFMLTQFCSNWKVANNYKFTKLRKHKRHKTKIPQSNFVLKTKVGIVCSNLLRRHYFNNIEFI